MITSMELIKEAVYSHRDMMLKAEREIWHHPQTGFKEWFAHNYLKEEFEQLGYKPIPADGIPGMHFDIDTGRKGPTLCIMGELDSIICPEHPECDPQTGAVHSCGHNCQTSALLGVAAALTDKRLLEGLCGKIRILAVPAEELLELGYRSDLIKQGKIHYMGGKVEFIYRGYFDDVDIAFMLHTGANMKKELHINKGSNGCIVKNITYIGKASHAGGSPDKGINALYAAQTGLAAANALRETFRDNDHIRFHPIVTAGGAMVNAIPGNAKVESYTRGASFDAMKAANTRINRALVAGALALGANVEIEDRPGYMPLNNDKNLMDLFAEVGDIVFGSDKVDRDYDNWGTGSTDMGDVSCIVAAIHPHIAGSIGTGHGADYYVNEPERAVVNSALMQVACVCALLENNAEKGNFIKENAHPLFPSIKAYLEAIDSVSIDGNAITYGENNTASVKWAK